MSPDTRQFPVYKAKLHATYSEYMSFPPRRCVLEIHYLYQLQELGKALVWSWSYREHGGHLGFWSWEWEFGEPLTVQVMSRPFRLLVFSGPVCRSLTWPWPNRQRTSPDYQSFSISSFWRGRIYALPWRDNPGCLAFLGSLGMAQGPLCSQQKWK